MAEKSSNLSKRIQDGIKFFRTYKNKYDSTPFKKYWPEFLSLVSEYLEGTEEFFKGREFLREDNET